MTHQPFRTDTIMMQGTTPVESSFPRDRIQVNTLAMTTQVVRFCFFTAAISRTRTGARMRIGGTNGATPTASYMGIYEIDQNDNGFLVAVTANTTTMFTAGVNTETAVVNFTSAWNEIANRRYAAAALFVGTTAPTVHGGGVQSQNTSTSNRPWSNRPYMGSWTRTGQSSLASSFTPASLTWASGLTMPYMEFHG